MIFHLSPEPAEPIGDRVLAEEVWPMVGHYATKLRKPVLEGFGAWRIIPPEPLQPMGGEVLAEQDRESMNGHKPLLGDDRLGRADRLERHQRPGGPGPRRDRLTWSGREATRPPPALALPVP